MPGSFVRILSAVGLCAGLAFGTLAVSSTAEAGSLPGSSFRKGISGYHNPNWRGSQHYRRYRHAPRVYRYRRPHVVYRRHRHYDPFIAGLGVGILGSIIAAPRVYGSPYVYRGAPRGYCHVHRYKLRGMTFHRDVRCFKHKYWDHPSIQYVR